ncbi:MAG: acyl carrier protein [Myxococcota bacterium]
MSKDDIRRAVLDALAEIAPEAKDAELPPDADIREELDLDSMDFLNLVTALHERLGVDIPESDYPRVATLAGMTDYVAAKTEGGRGT